MTTNQTQPRVPPKAPSRAGFEFDWAVLLAVAAVVGFFWLISATPGPANWERLCAASAGACRTVNAEAMGDWEAAKPTQWPPSQ
jgi:hypothetical protein